MKMTLAILTHVPVPVPGGREAFWYRYACSYKFHSACGRRLPARSVRPCVRLAVYTRPRACYKPGCTMFRSCSPDSRTAAL